MADLMEKLSEWDGLDTITSIQQVFSLFY